MVQSPEEALLSTCFQEVTGTAPSTITPVRPHASERRIYRLGSGAIRMVGVVNQSRAENDAFIHLARHFKTLGLPVPTIHLYRPEDGVYLEDDLGEITLLDYLVSERARTGEAFPSSVAEAYAAVLSYLPRFQIEAALTLDFSKLLRPHTHFAETLADDMRSFSTELVNRMLPTFDTASLASDFRGLVDYLASAQGESFLYRDFQSRNVMLLNG
jgi:aminoglycoside/choline kinase family phosphotransferase